MRVPIRKSGKFTHIKRDPQMTRDKLVEFKNELQKLKTLQPKLAEEVYRLAQLGDLSENAGYQIAKGKLRGINQKILELTDHIHKAVIIEPDKNINTVQVGSRITVDINNEKKVFTILGSSETNPTKGIISYTSPIGAALIGKKIGEEVIVKQKNSEIKCKIISID